MTGLLNTKETAARMEIPRRTFDTHAKLGEFKKLLARNPIGKRIYDAELVELFCQQRPAVKLIHRTKRVA